MPLLHTVRLAIFAWLVVLLVACDPDTVAPETTIDGGPSGTVANTGASFSFRCNEASCTYECQLNIGGWSSCTSPMSYSRLADDTYTFEVRAYDAVLNVDATPSSQTWAVDTTVPDTKPPQTEIDSGPSGTVASTGASFTFSCDEASCTYECQLNGDGWSSCASPTSYSGLADDTYTFYVRAYDAALNVDATPASQTWAVDTTVPDTTPPQTVIDSGPSGTVANTGTSFTFSCDEASCTYECQLNSDGWSSCTSPTSYSGLADDTYTFYVRAYDAALNVDATPASGSWTVATTPAGGANWVAIPGGTFSMGDVIGDGFTQELPVHSVTLSAFEMYATEVTNGEYQACVTAGACTAPEFPNSNTRNINNGSPYYGNATYASFPVIFVSWQQSADFCAWIGGRLPTEAEWEYAARGGLAGKRFPWGDTIRCSQANYYTTESYAYDVDPFVGSRACANPHDTTAVGSRGSNGFGLYDMAGNVQEWVADWYGSYSAESATNPTGPGTGTFRVHRGGAFLNYAVNTRVSDRLKYEPANQGHVIGFRCAR